MSKLPVSDTPAPPLPTSQRQRKRLWVFTGATLVALVVAGGVAVNANRQRPSIRTAPTDTHSTSPSADVPAEPQVGSCFFTSRTIASLTVDADDHKRVDCTTAHKLETIAVGSFQGEAAAEYPSVAGRATHDAFAWCEAAAVDFLGGHWATGYVQLSLSVPGNKAWQDGHHWYRCDVAETTTLSGPSNVSSRSLRGGLTGDRHLAITCLNWQEQDDNIDEVVPAPCDGPHRGEFAGSVRMDWQDVYDYDALARSIQTACLNTVTTFLGTRALRPELTFWYEIRQQKTPRTLDDWEPCVISAKDPNRSFASSLKGIGTASIPFA